MKGIDKTRFPLNDTREGMLMLFNDFLDVNTRVVMVEFSVLNTVESLLTIPSSTFLDSETFVLRWFIS
ncbi:MAG: hypothetical protein COB65_01570 [Thalassobium sp.]|nr:MAG: hypothetical protein COB65_01570 [Thalassobium sp.]